MILILNGGAPLRLLVLSDIHNRGSLAEKAIFSQPEAKHILFLGDGLSAFQEISSFVGGRYFYAVAGNCDFSASEPSFKLITVEGRKIFMAHGHTFNVKWDTGRFADHAASLGADIALYGHTHRAKIEYINGMYLINPGAVGSSEPSYATIDITKAGIVPNIVRL